MNPDANTNDPGSLWRQTLDAQREEATGFGGVLLLFAIGRVLAPFLTGATLVKLLPIFLNSQVWHALASPDSPAYHSLWMPAILFETIGTFLLLVTSIVILPLFFMRKKILPPVVIAYLALMIVYLWIDFVVVGFIPAARAHRGVGTAVQLAFYSIVSAAWIVCFFVADRVKSTFTR